MSGARSKLRPPPGQGCVREACQEGEVRALLQLQPAAGLRRVPSVPRPGRLLQPPGVCPQELPAAGGPVPAEAGAGAEHPVQGGAPAPGRCRGGGRGDWWQL